MSLPEFDHTKRQSEQGLYRKFVVTRTDGKDLPGNDHEGAEYFVLDMVYDPFAKDALLAYADACEQKYPELAKDLRDRFET